MSDDIQDLVEAFALASRRHFQATLQGDYAVANKQADRVHATFLKLRNLGPTARETLLQAAERGSDAAAVMAAVYSLKYDAKRSLAVLKRFSKDPGVLGFQASQAMKRWQTGEWQLE